MRTVHPDYSLTIDDCKLVRDCMEGAPAIKRETTTYLPHPSQIDTVSKLQKARYTEYLNGAEFDGEPDRLRRSMLGKLRINQSTIELPPALEYLDQNIDGDGLSLKSGIEYAVNNLLQTKWHALVVDHKSDAPARQLSQAEAERVNKRSSIKQYTRENVINWQFSRVGGVMQLSYVELVERTTKLNDGLHVERLSYLILALDDNGSYYQMIIDADGNKSEPNYPEINQKKLSWIPIIFIADEKLPNNHLPRQLGYLYGVCDLSLSKYRVSAVYKEVQRSLSPTTFSGGWKEGDMQIFKDSNNGRDYVSTGPLAVNNLPDGVTAQILSASSNMTDFQWYFTNAAERAKAFGGQTQSEGGAITATEAGMISADQNALLETIAECAQESFKRAISYCAMFDGLWAPDQVDANIDLITLELPRDFATPKLTVEERQQSLAEYQAGAISLLELQRQLEQGGSLVEDNEVIIAELEEQPPKILTTSATVSPKPKEAVPK